MESDDLENINTAMAKVSYINSRQFPTPGLRTLHVSTTIQWVHRKRIENESSPMWIEHCNNGHFKSALKSSVRLSLSVWCRCFGEDLCISIPEIKAAVMVMVPSEPQISITGTERVTKPAAELRALFGVALFKEIHIISTVSRSNGTFSLGTTAHNILLQTLQCACFRLCVLQGCSYKKRIISTFRTWAVNTLGKLKLFFPLPW